MSARGELERRLTEALSTIIDVRKALRLHGRNGYFVHVRAPAPRHRECEYWITEPFEAVVAYATIGCRVVGKPEETEATIAAARVRVSLDNLDDATAAAVLQTLDVEATARLRAAAPVMLETLRLLHSCEEELSKYGMRWIAEAIEQATGEKP